MSREPWNSWDDKQIKQVEGLLTQFNGAEEVAAVLGCDVSELDALCADAFAHKFDSPPDFARVRRHYAAIGRSLVRRSLMEEAVDGNMKAIEMLAREHLGLGAVELRKRAAAELEKATDSDDESEADFIADLRARREDRRSGAEVQASA